MGAVLLGAPLASSGSAVGLFGSGGVFSAAQTVATIGSALSYAAPVASLLSGAQQARAADIQTQAQVQQLEAQAAADRYNQQIAQQNVEIVKGQTQAELEKADRERRLRVGANIAAGGASGVGQMTDILYNNAAQEELNLLTIENEGLLRERNYASQANLLGASAANTAAQIPEIKAAGKTSKAASILGGVSSGLGMASKVGLI